jgi:ABC-2 type transport system ATP-binding protein
MRDAVIEARQPMNDVVIEAKRLKKRYGEFAAVDGIDLSVHRGEIFGLLGPNGAGKTTTILMLMGLTDVTAGRLTVYGHDPVREPLEVKRHVGYLPDSVGFYDYLTAEQNLRYTARLAGIPRDEIDERIGAALAQVGLEDAARKKTGAFSRGMLQRLGLAEVLMKKAEIAILDEPTSGLDPQATFEFLDMIRALKAQGLTVLLSSHLLDRVQAVCDRVALFHRGKIALQGTVMELSAAVLGAGFNLAITVRNADPARLLNGIPGLTRVIDDGDGNYRVVAERDVRAAVARALVAGGATLLKFDALEPSLDSLYRDFFEGQEGASQNSGSRHGEA